MRAIDISQLNKWFKDLDRMKMHGQERNLYVDSKTLKNSLMPVTQRGLEKCRGLLQQVARDRCVHSLQEHQHKMRDLGEQVTRRRCHHHHRHHHRHHRRHQHHHHYHRHRLQR